MARSDMSRKQIQFDQTPREVSPLEPILRTHLLMATDAFCEATGYSRSSIALYALQNGRLFNGLVDGATLNLRNYDRVIAYLAEKWPTGVQFPTIDDAAKSLKEANHHGKARKAKQKVRATG